MSPRRAESIAHEKEGSIGFFREGFPGAVEAEARAVSVEELDLEDVFDFAKAVAHCWRREA